MKKYAVIAFGLTNMSRKQIGGNARRDFDIMAVQDVFTTREAAVKDLMSRIDDIVMNAPGNVTLRSYGSSDYTWYPTDKGIEYYETVYDEDLPESEDHLEELRECLELHGHSHVEVEVDGCKATVAIINIKGE